MALAYFSCGDDDNSTTALNLEASDLNTTVVENPENSQVLGSITVNESDGTVYIVNSSQPQGAITVDAFGQVLVADPAAFDFESRSTITATVAITNGDSQTFSNVMITITDADDLLTLLTTSQAAYEAEVNGWFEVTEEEYNTLAARMAGVMKVCISDSDFNSSETTEVTAGNVTWANSVDVTFPTGSYLFAFKYVSPFGTDGNSDGQVRPKIGTLPASGYLGQGPLPAHGPGDRYFVARESVATNSTASHLGVYSPYSVGWKENLDNVAYYRFGNGNSLSNSINDVQILMQGLTTTQKQWD